MTIFSTTEGYNIVAATLNRMVATLFQHSKAVIALKAIVANKYKVLSFYREFFCPLKKHILPSHV